MNTPNMTAKDIGNGNKIEIVRLIPNDIPNQTNWLSRNCFLLLILIEKFFDYRKAATIKSLEDNM